MEEKRLEHPEERQDEKQEKKKQYPVTRRDFYGCVIILLIAVFLQGMQTRALIRREAQNMNNRCQNIESQMWNSISNIQDGIASSLAEADNPLQESSVEIAAADLKAKKVTLRMTAMPKESMTIQNSESILPKTVHEAMVTVPKLLTPAWMIRLEMVYRDDWMPAGSPIHRILFSRSG